MFKREVGEMNKTQQKAWAKQRHRKKKIEEKLKAPGTKTREPRQRA